jgi:hypothetical protein
MGMGPVSPKDGDFMSKKGEFSQRKSREFVDQKTDVIEFDFETAWRGLPEKIFFLVGTKHVSSSTNPSPN